MYNKDKDMALCALVMTALLLGACDGDSEPDPSTNNQDDPLAACKPSTLAPDHQPFGPAAGPVVDPDTGEVNAPEGSVVSTTYLALKPDASARFMELMGPIQADLQQRDGLLAVATAQSQQCGAARTITVWRDEAAMMAFVTGQAHAAAIQATGEVSRGGSVTMAWTHTGGAVAWDTTVARLGQHDGPVY